MAKVIAGVVGTLILSVLVGIVLMAINKFLLGVALVAGMIMIAWLVLVGVFSSKLLDIWKSF